MFAKSMSVTMWLMRYEWEARGEREEAGAHSRTGRDDGSRPGRAGEVRRLRARGSSHSRQGSGSAKDATGWGMGGHEQRPNNSPAMGQVGNGLCDFGGLAPGGPA